ncbi:hypothetical protein GCM10028773_48150 [Spirosoma koreense]
MYSCLVFVIVACSPENSQSSEEIAVGYTFLNEGTGFYSLLSRHAAVQNLDFIKKYALSDPYICAWQADSSIYTTADFIPKENRSSTYDRFDRFYIINTRNEKLYGPYRKDEFFNKAKSFEIVVVWKPVFN